jgi:TRAP-type C4-dicarboxylate transport system substrate-binding protein
MVFIRVTATKVVREMKKSLILLMSLAIVAGSALCFAGCADSTSENGAGTSVTATSTSESQSESTATVPDSEDQDTVTLRLADQLNTEEVALIEPVLADFKERTGGRYEIQIYTGGEIVAMPEALPAVQAGAIEMAGFPCDVFANLDSRLGVSQLPFLFNNVRAANAALEDFLPLYNSVLEEQFNQRVLTLRTLPPVDVIGAKKPIKTLEDWKGRLIQSISPVIGSVIDAFGGTPVSIPFSEAYSAIQKGLVDATIQSGGAFVVPYALYEVADYITLGNMLIGHGATVVNLDLWNSLPEDVQDIMSDSFDQIGILLSGYSIDSDNGVNEALTDLGMEVYILPETERILWREAVQSYYDETVAGLGDFGEEAINIAVQANGEFPYEAKE